MSPARQVLGRTGLEISRIGFGAARCRDDAPIHYRALADALAGGIDLVAATNADAGRSETLVGSVLARELGADAAAPVVVTTLAHVWAVPDEEASLADAVAASRARLGLERIDVVLLADAGIADAHGPEAVPWLRRAFERLERLAEAGELAAYGLSLADSTARAFDLAARAIDTAEAVAGADHRLGVLALPMNAVELGAARDRFAQSSTLLELARAAGLGVLSGRPLDVHLPGRSVRLVDAPASTHDGLRPAREALARVRKLEAAWATGLGQRLVTPGGDDAVDLFRFGQVLAARLEHLGSLEAWRTLRYDVLAPQLGRTSAALLQMLTGEAHRTFAGWWSEYGTALHHAFAAIEDGLGRAPDPDVADIERVLDANVPATWRGLPRSHKAVLTVLASTVDAVLVGMRRPTYVRDMLALREQAPGLASAGPVDFEGLGAAMAALQARTGRGKDSGPDGP